MIRPQAGVSVLQEGLFMEATSGPTVAHGLQAADPVLEHKESISGRREWDAGRKDEYSKDRKISVRFGNEETTGVRMRSAG